MLGQDKEKLIVVVGDIMLDEYVFGTVNRVSPESCCPILLSQTTSVQLGGAANVADQIRKLGKEVLLVGVIGKDKAGEVLSREFTKTMIDDRFVFTHDIVTTKKTRFVNDVHQQMFRVDNEEYEKLEEDEVYAVVTFLKENANSIHCVILSDYNKGVLTKNSCQAIIKVASENSIPTIVDIKVPDATKYQNATVIKGNLKEFSAFFKSSDTKAVDFDEDMRILKQKMNASSVVVTLGRNGMMAIDEEGHIIKHHANQVLVYDVTGAGDIVTAYIGTLYDSMSFDMVLKLANKAAEIKVTRFGNSHVSFNELLPCKGKVKEVSEILELTRGKKIVFTNGCFDVLHAGHIDLLQYAKTKGDILVVGVNSDISVKRLKGSSRPINSLEMRTRVLAAIGDIDYIVCFDDDTPERIIHEINPHVLIKGGDYTLENIVGADYVKSNGGMVEAMPFHYNLSTSKILSCL